MRRVAPVLVLLLVTACGGSGKEAGGPCGPCANAAGGAGLERTGVPRSTKLEHLAQERVELARKRLAELRVSFEHGKTGLDELFAASRDVAFAARDSGFHGEALRTVLADYRDAVVALRDLTRERMSKGAVGQEAMDRVDALVAEAQYWVAEAEDHP